MSATTSRAYSERRYFILFFAVVFTVALWYATFEMPLQLHQALLTFSPEYGILDSPPSGFVDYFARS